jgi:hypothetical protein
MSDTFVITEKGWEVYWRSQIANEVRMSHMPICVCERCGNLHDGYLVDNIIKTIRGEK